jgi:PAS domain S-box-containing protein
MRAHAELEKNEKRFREMNDAAVDVLCEIDEDGHVSYVSAAVYELLGYTPEQVIGSHFRLWIPRKYHAFVTERFEQLFAEPAGESSIRDRITLHAAGGQRMAVELMARTYCLSDRSSEDPAESSALPERSQTRSREGAWRFVATLRPVRDQPEHRAFGQLPSSTQPQTAPPLYHPDDSFNAAGPDDADVFPRDSVQPEHLTRAVEDSLFAAPDGLDASDWIETQKLVDRAQFALQSESSVTLRIDLRDAPAEIAGDEELLVACLRGLLGWGVARLGAKKTPHAVARSTPPQKLFLRVETAANSDVRFSVGLDWPRGPLEKTHERRPVGSTDEIPTSLTLCLTEAQDAALALGGHLKTRNEMPPSISPRTNNEISPIELAFDSHATKQMVEIPQPGRPESTP